LLDDARERAAGGPRVHEDDLVFTSGGTEANNLAVARRAGAAGPGAAKLVTTAVEHSSVLEPARRSRAMPADPCDVVGVDRRGPARPRGARRRARHRARLVSVMAANNEIGTLAPLAQLVAAASRRSAAPARVSTPTPCRRSARIRSARGMGRRPREPLGHKLGAPVGVGVLVRRKGVEPLAPLVRGGGQENGVRPGTENVAGIVASALAIELAVREREALATRLEALSHGLWRELHAALPKLQLVGPALGEAGRLPGTLNVLAPHVDGKVLVTRLDLAGLEVSAGSACASGSLEPSHVLLALGFARDEARAALRLSFGRSNTLEDVHNTVEILRRTLG
jgi:cysteine desulfurase